MDCLVTGGAGFIGSHVTEALVAARHRVRVLDNLATGSRANLAAVASAIEFVEGDVQDPALVARACAGVEVVFHLAALPSVPISISDPMRAHAMNATATIAVLNAAAHAKVRRFVFASSSSVYGHGDGTPAHESSPLNPLSPYAAQKLLGEHYARIYGDIHALETVCLRYFNVFGPRQDPSSPYSGVISIFCERLLRDEPVTIFGDGEQTRDFTYVDNVVAANFLAIAAKLKPAGTTPASHPSGCVLNVATGRSISINELYNRVSSLCGVTRPAQHAPARPGDVRLSRADIRQARELLGFEPKTAVEVGLERTIDWYRGCIRAKARAPTSTT